MTKLRLVISHNGEWASLRFAGTTILVDHVTTVTPGATVSRGAETVVLTGPGSATVDLITSVPDGTAWELRLAKSKVGEASAHVLRTNDVPAEIANISNTLHDNYCVVSRWVSRSALVGTGLVIPRVDPRKLVLAFYYPWFQEGSFDGLLWYDRPTGPYRTNDAADVAAMVNQAADANINGFIFSWNGTEERGARLDMLMDAARARGSFLVSVTLNAMYWESNGHIDLTAMEAAARSALDRASDPVFLRTGGRPVMFVFGANELEPAEWAAFADRFAAENPFFIGDTWDTEYGFDGSYMYNPNFFDSSTLKNKYIKASRELRLDAQVNPAVTQDLWAATVSPGENDSYRNPGNATVRDRRNGARYSETWSAALSSTPEWVLITTWNEWYEATHISPSTRFGTRALDQTRSWAASFRNPTAAPAPPSTSNSGVLPDLPLPAGGLSPRYP